MKLNYGTVVLSAGRLPRLPESGPGPAFFPRRPFQPLRPDRVQRFAPGDTVRVARGGFSTGPARITEVAADPHPRAYAHCSGRSAKYRIEGIEGWVYDWMLDPEVIRSVDITTLRGPARIAARAIIALHVAAEVVLWLAIAGLLYLAFFA